MVATREQLRNIIDVVDSNDLNVLYQVLVKFIPEVEPLPDEIEAIRLGREEIKHGELYTMEDIDWG